MTTLVSTIHTVVMESNNLWGFISKIDTGVAGQWVTLLAAIFGLWWGIRSNNKANRQSSQTIKKNTYEQIIDENKVLIVKLQKMRKDQDKWFLARQLLLGLPNGTQMITEIEEGADKISSDE